MPINICKNCQEPIKPGVYFEVTDNEVHHLECDTDTKKCIPTPEGKVLWVEKITLKDATQYEIVIMDYQGHESMGITIDRSSFRDLMYIANELL